jgi:uncharacterized protein (TIGR02271 family)
MSSSDQTGLRGDVQPFYLYYRRPRRSASAVFTAFNGIHVMAITDTEGIRYRRYCSMNEEVEQIVQQPKKPKTLAVAADVKRREAMMVTKQGLDGLTESTVYDAAGEKVGKVEQVYIDDSTHLPTWVSVKTGLFGISRSLVPLAGARHQGDRLEVAVTKSAVKDAPHLDADDGISERQNEELLHHYGLNSSSAGWDTYGKHAAPTPAEGAALTEPHNLRGGLSAPAGRPDDAHADDVSVVRSEERLNVDTDRVESGKARLRKYVVTENQSITVPVTREEVRVVREPLTGDSPTTEAKIGDDAVEVTLHEDKVTVHKETVPVERVGLAVDEVKDQHTVNDTVRKERVDTDGATTTDDNSSAQR